MLKNYVTIAIRNILKYKLFSAINILGMTVGITACLFIILYITDELSYDRFHENADRIYQVGLHGKIAGQELRVTNTCPPLAAALAEEVPGVEASLRILPFYGAVIKNEEKTFTEQRVFYADSNFFRFFSFNVLEGNPATALQEVNSAVLTESMAIKYFGNTSVVGKLLTIGNDNKSYKVTAITPDCATNSHFIYNILLSASSNERLKSQLWLNNFLYTYFILDKNTSLASVKNKLDDLVVKYVGPEAERVMGVSIKKMKEQGGVYGYYTTKLTDIHLYSTSDGDIEPGGKIMYIYFFGAIGIFIVLIACINFMNLATAQSAGRAKEVGLRKTLGSLRNQMIAQFMAESVIYSFITIILALALCSLLLPYFNLLSGKQLAMSALVSPIFIFGSLTLMLLVGILAGSYPAFYLTSFNAVEVLKGKVKAGAKSKGIRSVLVVSQFSLSIFLIIFTAVVYQQISYMENKDLGLDKKNVVIINNIERVGKNLEGLKNTIEQQAGIVVSSFTNNSFPGVNNTTVFRSPGSDQDHIMGNYQADYDHLDVMKFELKEGRYFSEEFPSDSTAILINEAAAKEFGFTNPLEEELSFYEPNQKTQRLKIIGVIKDFNFESLKDHIRPISVRLTKSANQLFVRYQGNPKEVLATMEKVWKKTAPNEPFDYEFLDENFDRLFRTEQRMGGIFSVFSFLAISIASLGLFALAAFTAEQRTKEIGIRKVMGASVISLTILLSKEFTKLVVVAFVPAAIVGWYIASRWLEGFANHVDVDPLIVVWSGLGAVTIAWLTVSYQAIKTAIANPVTSLRYE